MLERRKKILDLLEQEGRVDVNELSEILNCSKVTIRSDIRALEEENQLVRIHGGAVKKEENFPKYRAKSIYRHVEEKKAIAACAYEFIQDQDTIIIDDASSSFYLALHIKAHHEKHIGVVTNSLLVANELADVDHVDLLMIGGYVGGRLAATLGEAAAEEVGRIHVDKAFMGVHGINFDAGLTSLATPQKQIKQAILKTTDKVYVLADSSKFDNGFLSIICPFSEIHKIITDRHATEEQRLRAAKNNVPLVIAK